MAEREVGEVGREDRWPRAGGHRDDRPNPSRLTCTLLPGPPPTLAPPPRPSDHFTPLAYLVGGVEVGPVLDQQRHTRWMGFITIFLAYRQAQGRLLPLKDENRSEETGGVTEGGDGWRRL